MQDTSVHVHGSQLQVGQAGATTSTQHSPALPICNASGCMPSANTEADSQPLLPACTVPANLHSCHLWSTGMQPA